MKTLLIALSVSAMFVSSAYASASSKPAVVKTNVDLIVEYDGDYYVADHGLSMSDCMRSMRSLKAFSVAPGIELDMSVTTARACVAK